MRSSIADAPDFIPKTVAVGDALSLDGTTFQSFTLDRQNAIATLDYETERAGYPFFSVSTCEGNVQVEVKYSEAFISLSHPWSDGPYLFDVSLANGFRAETFNITTPGEFDSLLQGGQRWQTIRLLTTGSVTFDAVGFRPSVETTEIDQLPGQFSSDNEVLNNIWNLGAKSASVACVDEGSQKAVWDVDAEKGIYVRSLRPAQSINGSTFANYTLDFDLFIERAGAWWSVVSETWLLHTGKATNIYRHGHSESPAAFN